MELASATCYTADTRNVLQNKLDVYVCLIWKVIYGSKIRGKNSNSDNGGISFLSYHRRRLLFSEVRFYKKKTFHFLLTVWAFLTRNTFWKLFSALTTVPGHELEAVICPIVGFFHIADSTVENVLKMSL